MALSLYESNSIPLRRQRALNRNILLHLAMLCVWVLVFLVMTSPKDDVDFDGKLRKLKLLGRGGSLLLLTAVNFIAISRTPLNHVIRCALGFILFCAYCFLSVAWSPIPNESLIQCVGLFTLVLLAITIAHLTRERRHARIVLFHLTCAIISQGIVMLSLHVITGTAVGRDETTYFHATDAANNFGLGTLLLIGCATLTRFRWARLLLLPGMILLISLGAISHNRLSIALTPLVVLPMLVLGANRKVLFSLLFAGVLAVPALLLLDAKTDALSRFAGVSESVAQRGENDTDGFNGRDKLWAIIWHDYKKHPIRGHGYMMTSSTGRIAVWNKYRNYDAHNQIFHVLATTGIVGLILFLWGIFSPLKFTAAHWNRIGWQGELARMFSVMFLWLFLWGLLNVSFSGYINSCSIVFFTLLGLSIGCLSRKPESRNPWGKPPLSHSLIKQ